MDMVIMDMDMVDMVDIDIVDISDISYMTSTCPQSQSPIYGYIQVVDIYSLIWSSL